MATQFAPHTTQHHLVGVTVTINLVPDGWVGGNVLAADLIGVVLEATYDGTWSDIAMYPWHAIQSVRISAIGEK